MGHISCATLTVKCCVELLMGTSCEHIKDACPAPLSSSNLTHFTKTTHPTMTRPEWIPAALFDALLSEHSPWELPITICITPCSITFCRGDGAYCTHHIPDPLSSDSLLALPFDDLPDLPLPDVTIPLSSDPGDAAQPSSVQAPAAVQEILDDVSAAPEIQFSVIDQPAGSIADQATALLARYQRTHLRTCRNRLDELDQLHVTYLLGRLYSTNRSEVQALLARKLTRRQRANIVRGLKRTYTVVSRVGLARLYGTSTLTY